MARRSLSPSQIKAGMAYIYNLVHVKQMSARDIMKDPNLPFSLTTYYKYLPKFEKKMKNKTIEVDNDLTPTKAIERNTKRELEAQNQSLLDEVNLLTRFIVKKYITTELEQPNENGHTNSGIH